MEFVHIYFRENGGSLRHHPCYRLDLYGEIGAVGEVIALKGWPTPAMRPATDGMGNPTAWFVGTDEQGEIVPAAA